MYEWLNEYTEKFILTRLAFDGETVEDVVNRISARCKEQTTYYNQLLESLGLSETEHS